MTFVPPTVAQEWQEFCEHCFPGVAAQELQGERAVFYAGYQLAIMMVWRLPELPPEQGRDVLLSILRELSLVINAENTGEEKA